MADRKTRRATQQMQAEVEKAYAALDITDFADLDRILEICKAKREEFWSCSFY